MQTTICFSKQANLYILDLYVYFFNLIIKLNTQIAHIEIQRKETLIFLKWMQ
jgi:hypothetical protein